MIEERKRTSGHLLAFITILIWGTTFISTKTLLTDFGPIEILLYRFILGYAALAVVSRRPIRTASFREERLFMAAGLCGVTLYFLVENIALIYTTASNAGVIVSIAPFFTAVFAHFLLQGEALHSRFITGFVIALTGIILIGLNGSLVLELNPLGDLLAFIAPMVWALYSVLMCKISGLHYSSAAATRRVFFYGLLFMLPVLFLSDFRTELHRFADLPNVLNLLYLGLGASALCFITWNRAVGILGAVTTSLYIYIVPVITVAASALLLQEKLTWLTISGTLLTLAGSFISERKSA